MKIKSHTGNMVEARVGMVVELGKPIDGCSAQPAGNRHIVNTLCDTELFDYECTMIECPFQVGDLIQVDCGHNFASFGIEKYSSPEYRRVRHLNPDLRSKGEV